MKHVGVLGSELDTFQSLFSWNLLLMFSVLMGV